MMTFEASTTLVSVVVPTRNSKDFIARCLDSIARSTYKDYEIIVVDGNSTDGTIEEAKKFDAKIVTGSGKGRAADCNLGIACSKGNIVAFTDADCVVDHKWLERIVMGFQDPKVGGVGGPDVTDVTTTKNAIGRSAGHLHDFYRISVDKRGAHAFIGANSSYRRKCLDLVGGFDPALVGAEEIELNSRILNAQFEIKFDPDCLVYHTRRSRLRPFLKQYWRLGYELGILYALKRTVEGGRRGQVVCAFLALIGFMALFFLSAIYQTILILPVAGIAIYTSYLFLLHRKLVNITGYKSNFGLFLLLTTLAGTITATRFGLGFIKTRISNQPQTKPGGIRDQKFRRSHI